MSKYGTVKIIQSHLSGTDVRNALLMAIANESDIANRIELVKTRMELMHKEKLMFGTKIPLFSKAIIEGFESELDNIEEESKIDGS